MASPKFKDTDGVEQSGITAIKQYFGSPGYPEVKLPELKPLVLDKSRDELAIGAAKELGWTIIEKE